MFLPKEEEKMETNYSTLMNTHSLERTSPYGEAFVGKCMLCGKEGLRMEQANESCENPDKKSYGEALLDAIAPETSTADSK